MRDDCPIARNIMDRQDRVLRKAEERGLTIADLAAETDIPAPTLLSYRRTNSREPSLMSLAAFVKIARALAANRCLDLACLLIEDSGLDLIPKKRAAKDWFGLGERMSAFVSKVCRYQATGPGIDHREELDLTDELRRLGADARAMVE